MKKSLFFFTFLYLTAAFTASAQDYLWINGMGATDNDRGYSIAVDDAGNVYTAGYFEGTVDFDPGAGTEELTSAGEEDIFITKMNADGNLIWAKRMGGTGEDVARSMTIDDSGGNLYITGYFEETVDFDPGAETTELTSNGNNDIFISKLDKDGNHLWAKSMGDTFNDNGFSLSVDRQDNIYVTGFFYGTVDFDPNAGTAELTHVAGEDIFVTKLDKDGNYLWAKSMGGGSNDWGKSLAVDDQGNVYTTGFFYGTADFDPGAGTAEFTSTGQQDLFISKLDTDGNYIWCKTMGNSITDDGYSIAVDGEGNAYTTGTFQSTIDFDPNTSMGELTSNGTNDIFISKLDKDGNYLWAKNMGGSNTDYGFSLVIDHHNNIYTVGAFRNTVDFDPGAGTAELTSVGILDIFISKLDSDGNYLWVKGMGGTDSDIAYSIAVNDEGNVYTTGIFQNTVDFDPGAGTAELTSAGNRDIFIGKYCQIPAQPEITSVTQPTCEVSTGSITVTAQYEGEEYSFDNGESFQSENFKSDLTAGTYEVIIKNACGSSVATQAVVDAQPTVPTAPVTSITQPTCDFATGIITITEQIAGETYSFDNGVTFQNENTVSGLSEGTYEVIIMSTDGCSSTATQAVIDAQPATPDKPEITSDTTDPKAHILTSSNASGNQWYLNEEIIAEATDASITVTEEGEYTVQTTLGDCTGDVSDPFVIREQTITFSAIEDQVLEAGTLTLAATASSGLEVSYEIISGSATVTGSAVAFTSLGTITISASQAGSDAFFAATDVEQSFEVITVTGIRNDLVNKVHFYPNPVNNYITIQAEDQLVQVEVLEMSGKQMIVERDKQLDVSQLTAGNYLLKVTTTSDVYVHQFIKK